MIRVGPLIYMTLKMVKYTKKSAYIWALNYAKQHPKGVGTFSDPKVAGQS